MINTYLSGPVKVLQRILIIFCLVGLSSNSSSGNAASSSHQHFPRPSANFTKYVEQVEGHLIANRLRNRSLAEVRLNLPFEIPASNRAPYRGKFLLIHGLNDSAYVWTDLAKVIAARGFDVRAVLLPGHGSHPQRMLDISFRSWLRSVRAHYAHWKTDDTPIYLGGFSLGGVLATILALENPDIAGLLLISPAYHSKLNSLLRWSWAYAWFRPWMFGGLILEDNPIKYNSIPINSGTQYFRTTVYLKNLLQDDIENWQGEKLKMPVLMVTTANDSVVDPEYSRHMFHRRMRNPSNRLLIYGDIEDPAMPREVTRNSYYPQRRILNLSHLSLVNSADNPLFGETGNILVCNGNEYPVFFACMRSHEHWYGAQHTPSPDGTAVARSTYNPDFNTIISLFDQVFVTKVTTAPGTN